MLDKKDAMVLKLLKDDAKLSIKEISKKTLLPITTIHNRIKKLEKKGIIRNYTINLDDKKLGTISAFVSVSMDYKTLRSDGSDENSLLKKIRSHDSVESVCMLTGDVDMLVKVRVENVNELDKFVIDFLRKLDGIERTNTMVILSEI
ncbi:AsnC family transcriptional regulator [archaeon]|nr:AsnC family transcriptional regulator [archaeon]